MSLKIDTNKIRRVLLKDGNWYPVKDGSFDLDSYEFMEQDFLLNKGECEGVCSTGFSFVTSGGAKVTNSRGERSKEYTVISGPLTAILAVEYTINKLCTTGT